MGMQQPSPLAKFQILASKNGGGRPFQRKGIQNFFNMVYTIYFSLASSSEFQLKFQKTTAAAPPPKPKQLLLNTWHGKCQPK